MNFNQRKSSLEGTWR